MSINSITSLVVGRRLASFLLLSFLVCLLSACGGDSGGSGSGGNGGNGDPGNGDPGNGDPGNGDPGNGDPGNGDPGNGGSSPSSFKVELTFAPIPDGFQIGNQSAFVDMVSLSITATNGTESVNKNITITEFADDSYNFTGLGNQSNWTFTIIGTLGDSRQQRVAINFVWPENEEDHNNEGIRSGLDTDRDRRANSVDDDDDGDGRLDHEDNCPVDANDNQLDTDRDQVGDACDTDDDNDGLDDVDEPEGCELKSDCDNDRVGDGDEEAGCVQNTDCDNDRVGDGDEEAGCVQNIDCDNDRVGDGVEARGCAKLTDCDSDGTMDGADVDDDGDGLIEIGTAAELDEVRYALDGDGRRSSAGEALNTTGCVDGGGTNICSGYELVADISLAAYRDGKGWRPLGNDTGGSRDGCQGAAFNGTFEGNGFMISDLNISRSGEDCVGLFGYIAAGSEIRNLRLSAEAVIGRGLVGGLVGNGQSIRIISSSVVVGVVRGANNDWVGGLVGEGEGARIYASSVVAGEVRGSDFGTGGLVGNGRSAQIYSSSVVAGKVRWGEEVGGLVGFGREVQIYSSSVVVGEVRGGENVGGLVGFGQEAQIYSSSVVAAETSRHSSVGGLVGTFDLTSGQIAYSYVVSGSPTNMLAGLPGGTTGVASYWDNETSGVGSGNIGEPKTSDELRGPTDYMGIYDDWEDDTNIFNDGMSDEPLAVWCDRDNSGSIEAGEGIDANRIWDFGTSSQYPAIKCTPISPTEWRDWWFLNATGKPQLNQTRLDAALDQ